MWPKLLALILVQCSFNVYAKDCVGTKVDVLEDDCTAINDSPLIIEQLGQIQLPYYGEKLKGVENITAGLIIQFNAVENLNILPKVRFISNFKGPAIVFRKNTGLRQFNFPRLVRVKGQFNQAAVHFDNEEFFARAYVNPVSYESLYELETKISPSGCSVNSFEATIDPKEDAPFDGADYAGFTVIAVIVLVELVVVGLLVFVIFRKPKRKPLTSKDIFDTPSRLVAASTESTTAANSKKTLTNRNSLASSVFHSNAKQPKGPKSDTSTTKSGQKTLAKKKR